MLYEAIFLAVVAGWIARGRIAHLAQIRLSRIWLIFLAFGIQVGMDVAWSRGFKGIYDFRLVLQAVSYVLLFIFLWIHRDWPGAGLLALGFALNFFVIAVNGGVMPSTIEGLDQSYVRFLQDGQSVTYAVVTDRTRFPWLGDMMIFPWPKAKAFSAGDIFISLGVFWLVFKSMTGKRFSNKLTSVRGIKM